MFSPHSVLGSVWGGVNDWLAKGLGKGWVCTLLGEKLEVNVMSEGTEGCLVILMNHYQ